MNDYALELENTIWRLIALLDAARAGSAEHRMILRQLALAGVRERIRNGGGSHRRV
jgi:hypothetical protein